ncbi:MAG: hypothetical protein ACJ703_04005 [Nitrososphaera sp.]
MLLSSYKCVDICLFNIPDDSINTRENHGRSSYTKRNFPDNIDYRNAISIIDVEYAIICARP